MYKVCKQCSRNLDESAFRRTKSRSTGKYNSTPGLKTICRECESLNARAHAMLKKIEQGLPVDEAKLEALKKHYANYTPVTAAARRLMGLDPLGRSGAETNMLLSLGDELTMHCQMVRARTYASASAADEAHRRLADKLRAYSEELYEEITMLVDDWYFEED